MATQIVSTPMGFCLLMIRYFRWFQVALAELRLQIFKTKRMRIQLVDATNAVIELPAGTYDISLEFYGKSDFKIPLFFLPFLRFRAALMTLRNLCRENKTTIRFLALLMAMLMQCIGWKNMMFC